MLATVHTVRSFADQLPTPPPHPAPARARARTTALFFSLVGKPGGLSPLPLLASGSPSLSVVSILLLRQHFAFSLKFLPAVR